MRFALSAVLLASAALAQPPAPSRDRHEHIAHVAKLAEEAFNTGDWAQAELHLREQVRIDPKSWIPRFNLAIALAKQDRTDNAATELLGAIDAGYFDLARLQREPALDAVREHATIAPLLKDWTSVLDTRLPRRVALIETIINIKPKESIRDEHLNVIYRSWVSPRSLQRVREELPSLARFANTAVFDDFPPQDPDLPDVPVIIALPVQRDFKRWITSRFGSVNQGAFASIGGAYEPEQARLVSSDLGASLRHEFFHALHWRLATRLGQRHPIWFLEGLASLVEDIDASKDATELKPVPGWRTNMAKRMLASGTLPDIVDLIAANPTDFASKRPLANYAHARALFLYLHDRGHLPSFWRIYTSDPTLGYDADRSARKALEAATSLTLDELERDFRDWLRNLDDVAESIEPGMASLGIEVENGPGDGVQVVGKPDIQAAQRANDPKLLQVATSFALGDIILALDDRPTRDIAELLRVLGTLEPDQDITILLRRGQEEREFNFTLMEKP
jgi:hypothetical protein